MYESLLPERARDAYRQSRWKKRLDQRVERLLGRGYSLRTAGLRLTSWVDFTCQYEGEFLPSGVHSPDVVSYLDRRCKNLKEGPGHIRTALRLLLEPEERVVLRMHPKRDDTELYKEHVPDYLAFERQHRGRRTSHEIMWVLHAFFDWLDHRGIESMSAIGTTAIRGFLDDQRHLKRSTISEQASVLRCFFRYLSMLGVVRPELVMVIESPRIYRMSTPPKVLDEETIERLITAVDRSTPLGKRDYATLLLAARYGMRPSDIRGLRFEDIRWREQRISMLQSKTQRPLELPLLADVDEALVDYLRNGRPACTFREIFVRHLPPIGPLSKKGSLRAVLWRAFDAAGLELPPPWHRGLYVLRHSAATRMLAQGVPFETISDVLGHASVETTRVYAQVDLPGLRSVALSSEEVCR